MIAFYKNREKRTIEPQLFSATAMKWAEEIFNKGGRDANKRTQIRKFYDEVLRLNALVKANPAEWENILPYVNMVIAQAAYARGRNKVTDEFVNMLKDCIGQVQTPKDLDVFAGFFEAFMGFYRQDRDGARR